jgi:acyl-coenzyme A synthetase/AMP-(fatty) acid ligase
MKHAGVHDIFARAASERGSSVALDCEGKITTYRELAGNASRLANLLLAKGLRKGDVVAIMLGDPARVIAAIIAVLDAGGIFAPLDPKLPLLRIQNSLSIIEPNLLIYDQASSRLQAEAFHGCSMEFDGVEHLSQSDQRPMRERSGEEPCSIYFTSGSTGKPKAILGRLKGIDHFVLWEIHELGIDESSRVSQLTSSSSMDFLKTSLPRSARVASAVYLRTEVSS